jgi:hypothetical protein
MTNIILAVALVFAIAAGTVTTVMIVPPTPAEASCGPVGC